MQNTWEEYEAISRQRNQQILSSAPSWPPLSLQIPKKAIQEILSWAHQHLKVPLMPVRKIREGLVQKKCRSNQQCWKPRKPRPDVAM